MCSLSILQQSDCTFTLGVYGSVSLHEVLNVKVIQSVPGWWRLSGALGHSRRHLQTHLFLALELSLSEQLSNLSMNV